MHTYSKIISKVFIFQNEQYLIHSDLFKLLVPISGYLRIQTTFDFKK